MKNKKILTALLSLILPGLGHLYIGKVIDGAIFLVMTAFLWIVVILKSSVLMRFDNPRSLIVWGALVLIYIYAIYDSYRKSR